MQEERNKQFFEASKNYMRGYLIELLGDSGQAASLLTAVYSIVREPVRLDLLFLSGVGYVFSTMISKHGRTAKVLGLSRIEWLRGKAEMEKENKLEEEAKK